MKKPKPLDKYTRAVRYAKRTFKLKVFVHAGKDLHIAWITGFDAAGGGGA